LRVVTIVEMMLKTDRDYEQVTPRMFACAAIATLSIEQIAVEVLKQVTAGPASRAAWTRSSSTNKLTYHDRARRSATWAALRSRASAVSSLAFEASLAPSLD
jgi:hypothetical protein